MTSQTEHEDIQKARQLLKNRRYKKAIECATLGLANTLDEYARTHYLYILLSVYNQQDYLIDAAEIIANLPEKKRLPSELLVEVAKHCQKIGEAHRALDLLEYALANDPSDKTISIELGVCYALLGEKQKALQYFLEFANGLDGINVNDNRMLLALQKISTLQELSEHQRTTLDESFSNTLAPSQPQSRMGFILASNARHQNAPDQEALYLAKANTMMLDSERKNGKQWSTKINAKKNRKIRELFDTATPDWLPSDITQNDDHALFILGMPESSAPFIEQLVCTGSDYVATGNSKGLRTSMFKARKAQLATNGSEGGLLEMLASCTTSFFDQLARQYSQHQRLASGGASMYTDCLFSNSLWVGLLANIFPNAKFIHAQSDARLNCLNLLRKPALRVPFSTDPKHAAEAFYIYDNRMRYWKTLYPERILEIDDPALQDELPKTVEKIRRFLGTESSTIDDALLVDLRETYRYHLHPLGQTIAAKQSDYAPYNALLQPAFDVIAMNENNPIDFPA